MTERTDSTGGETPRVDALDFGDQWVFDRDGYGQLWRLARALERELSECRALLHSEHDAHMECHAKTAEARRDGADAARYRWLRGDGLRWIRFQDGPVTLTTETCDVGLDAAIDSALSSQTSKGEK